MRDLVVTSALTEKPAVKTDPELLRQISSARSKHEPVVGIFRLKPEDSGKLLNSPKRTDEIVKEVVDRVAKKVGSAVQRMNVLRNLGVVILSAEPNFISELLKQPEIYSAMANQPGESGKIEPINKRSVSESAIDKPVNRKTSNQSAKSSAQTKGVTSSRKAPLKKAAAKKR